MSTDFATFTLLPVSSTDASSCSVVLSSDGKWKTSSFYLDSSGSASVSLPLELKFPSETILQEYVARDCFRPRPDLPEAQRENVDTLHGKEATPQKSSICIEAKVTLTFGSGEAITATVENVKLLSTKIIGASVFFDSDITVRVSRPGGASTNSNEASGVKTALDVSAVHVEKLDDGEGIPKNYLDGLKIVNSIGSQHRPMPKQRVRYTRTSPFSLQASLTQALSISIKSVSGCSMGQTLLALAMRHPGTHTEAITVTNIALHPRLSKEIDGTNASPPATDASKIVTWQYAPRADPKLPLILEPHEVFSTILAVDATQDIKCRTFTCPVSVTALLGRKEAQRHRYKVVASTEATWETSKAAIEPSDSFLINLSLGEQTCHVGALLTVIVHVRNLSTQPCDLMLLVSGQGVCPDVEVDLNDEDHLRVSEKDGYKFSVRGLSLVESTYAASRTDTDLITVDVAYLVGFVGGQSTADAVLRFIPLRQGSVSIPNIQVVDRKSGKSYTCLHKLRATVEAAG
jgi:hypothetical protein